MTLPDVREVVKSLLEEQRTTEDVGIPATHANRYYVYKAGDLAGAQAFSLALDPSHA